MMISDKTNEMRKDIMIKFKYQQVKKGRKLKEFMRNAKKKIQIKRDGGIVSESDDDDEAMGKTLKISELIQNAKTQEEKDKYRKMYQEQKQQQLNDYKNDYVGYIQDKVVKG